MADPEVLVVDNGTLSLPALCKSLEKVGAQVTTIAVGDVAGAPLPQRYKGLVLSGTKVRAYDSEFYARLIDTVFGSTVPVWGICGGMQLIALARGSTLQQGPQRVGNHTVTVDAVDPVFNHCSTELTLFQRHTLYVDTAPDGFEGIGRSDLAPVEFIRSHDHRIYGSQAHLEFRADGRKVLQGFVDVVRTF
ncbi:type 1 glutamine amidotransferase [Rhodococcus sp. 077-4]|uniref:type 1 glutamine amidotransferase n=1 Tax=Rhodococcus sp. 077-4 TaxID=2789271 RepID=UPI0039F5D13A